MAARAWLDDIDDDDTPATSAIADAQATASAAGAVAAATDSAAAPAASSSSAAAASTSGRSTSGVDDIDGDDSPSSISNDDSSLSVDAVAAAASSSAHTPAASPPPPTPAACEVQRILAVLAADAALALSHAAPAAVDGVAAAVSAAPAAQRDHFSVLDLPQPDVSLVGEGVWSVDESEVKRAFKRLVLLIHPDKNPVIGAKDAFEAVKLANTILGSDTDRYDYIKAYTLFRRSVAMRAPDFLPASVVAATLDETLEQGRLVAAAKAAHTSSIAARLHAQAEARRALVAQGEIARRRKDEERKKEELKRKVMESDDSDSDDEREMSVAEKIRRAKQGGKKKIRAL